MNQPGDNAAADSEQPRLTLVDLQAGRKTVPVVLKTGEQTTLTVVGLPWLQLAELHSNGEIMGHKFEEELVQRSLPNVPEGFRLDWLDIASRNELTCVVREFAYGYVTEKKRRAMLQEILQGYLTKHFATASGKDSSASGADSAQPTSGAGPSPSSDSGPTSAKSES